MLDGVSLDQLRTFIASVDEGSFSAAARKLRRAQSVVSDLVSGLEAQVGVQLFDRSGRYPKLTPAGAALLADARGVVAGVDFMKTRAKGMSSGLEPELSVVVDVLYPIATITDAANAFREQFPGTPLRLFVEALGGTHQRVLDGLASVGVAAAFRNAPSSLSSERLAGVALVMVAARHHPLASFKGTIPKSELAKHVQLVLTDRSALSAGVEFAVMSSSVWHLTDLFAKHLLPSQWTSVAAKVLALNEVFGGIARITFQMTSAVMKHETMTRSIKLLGAKVAPIVRAATQLRG